MSIGWYVVQKALSRCLLCAVLLTTIYVTVDLVEVTANSTGTGWLLLRHYPLKLPLVVSQILPLALLMGVLLAVASMAQAGEWEMLMSSGIRPLKLVVCLLLVPLGSTLVAAALVLKIAPMGLACWAEVAGTDSGRGTRASWIKYAGAIVRIGSDADGPMIDRAFFGLSPAKMRFEARRPDGSGITAWRPDTGWQEQASFSIKLPQADRVPTRTLNMGDAVGSPPGSGLDIWQLMASIEWAHDAGRNPNALRAELALRIALLAACLVLPLLGLAVGLGVSDRRATVLLLYGLLTAVAYWFCLATAWNGAVIGAWSTHFVWAFAPALFTALAIWRLMSRNVVL